MKKITVITILLTFIVSSTFCQWTQMSASDLEDCSFRGMYYSGGNILGYGEAGGIFKSTDKGKNWSFSGYGLDSSGLEVRQMGFLGSDIYIIQDTRSGQQMYKSTNNGLSWSKVSIKWRVHRANGKCKQQTFYYL